MIVLKATQGQYNSTNRVPNKYCYVEYLKDNNGNWITSVNVRSDPNYTHPVSDILKELEEIEYVPKIEEDEIV